MIDSIDLLASAMASDRDAYSNLSWTNVWLVSELVISNKNLVKLLK